METNPLRKRYKTRSTTTKSVARSQVDWRRTKKNIFPESQEDDDEITSSSSSTSSSTSSSSSSEDPKSSSKHDVNGKEEETSILSKGNGEDGSDADFQKGGSDVSSEDLEDGNISFGKRKRPREAMIYDSDESSDSDVPRKVVTKGQCIISEDNLSVDGESPTSPAEKAANKKQERQIKLQEMSLRQSRKSGKVNQQDEKCCSAMKEKYHQDEPAKDLVKQVFSQLKKDNWICKEYSVLDRYLDKVTEFQKKYEDFKRNTLSFV